MSPIGIAASGLGAAQTRLYTSAVNIASGEDVAPVQAVQSSLPGGGVKASVQPRPSAPNVMPAVDELAATAGGVDLSAQLVQQAAAMTAFKASLAVIQTAEDMAKAAFDSIA